MLEFKSQLQAMSLIVHIIVPLYCNHYFIKAVWVSIQIDGLWELIYKQKREISHLKLLIHLFFAICTEYSIGKFTSSCQCHEKKKHIYPFIMHWEYIWLLKVVTSFYIAFYWKLSQKQNWYLFSFNQYYFLFFSYLYILDTFLRSVFVIPHICAALQNICWWPSPQTCQPCCVLNLPCDKCFMLKSGYILHS